MIDSPTTFNKPARATDSTGEGGPTVRVVRDTTGQSGGTHGYVNCASYTYSIAGSDMVQFEWNGLFVLDNYANRGENCAGYFQTNVFGRGANFGLVAEVCSIDPNSTAQMTGFEADAWVSGPVTEHSKTRIANDTVFGDGQYIRTKTRSSQAEVHFGHRVAASGDTPWARAIVGQLVADFKQVGHQLQAPPEGAVRGFQPKGKYIVLFDSSAAECETAWRLAAGQRIALDQYDQITLQRVNDRVVFANNTKPFFEIDINTGDIFKKGVKL